MTRLGDWFLELAEGEESRSVVLPDGVTSGELATSAEGESSNESEAKKVPVLSCLRRRHASGTKKQDVPFF